MIKRYSLLVSLALGLSSFVAQAEQMAINEFGLLNNNESSVIIGQREAQDLLNVDVSAGGRSVKKRSGYGTYKTLGTGQAIHGGYQFFDSAGNDVQIWASSTSLYGIVSDGTPVQLISTATLNATWDCADTQGFAYCVSSSRNGLIRINGATHTYFGSPAGTMVEMTPTRLVVAGVSGSASTIYHSKAGDYTNFTTGIDEADAFTEVIAAPGSRLTHLRYACGKLLWWKDRSFGQLLGDDQNNVAPTIISDTIGTQDNDSSIDPAGNVWFRAQDGHIYTYDCAVIEKRSTDITPEVQSSGRRTSNSYTLTSQTDFQTGVSSHTNHLSFTLSPGNVVTSSATRTEATASAFNNGTGNSIQVIGNVLVLSRSAANVLNHSFETGTGNDATDWNESGANWGRSGAVGKSFGCGGGTFDPQDGAMLIFNAGSGDCAAEIIDAATSATISSTFLADSCIWSGKTLNPSDDDDGRRVKIRLTKGAQTNTSDSFILNGDVSFSYARDHVTEVCYWDFFTGGRSTVSSGTYTSAIFDTSFQNSYVRSAATWDVNDAVPAFNVNTATSTTGVWTQISTSTGTEAAAKRYIRWGVTLTVGAFDDALTTVNSVSLVTRSSGTYLSPVRNAPLLSAWDTFTVNKADNGGSHQFYLRSSTSSFSILSSTPSWTGLTAGSVISASTGTFFQFRDDMAVFSTTDTPTLNDFTINWFEGNASDKAYSVYFDDAIWWSISRGAGETTNNYIFRYDLLNQGWGLYSFGSNGFLIQNNRLYFGSPSAATIYRFGDSTSDAGSAINSYWKSKDFPGSDPWIDNTYKQLDVYTTRNQNETLTVTYGVGTSTNTTSYNVSLSTSSSSVIVHRKILPLGRNGPTFNVKVGDNSANSAWEVLGIRFVFDPLSYRPSQ